MAASVAMSEHPMTCQRTNCDSKSVFLHRPRPKKSSLLGHTRFAHCLSSATHGDAGADGEPTREGVAVAGREAEVEEQGSAFGEQEGEDVEQVAGINGLL
jgi:hypothetical protein